MSPYCGFSLGLQSLVLNHTGITSDSPVYRMIPESPSLHQRQSLKSKMTAKYTTNISCYHFYLISSAYFRDNFSRLINFQMIILTMQRMKTENESFEQIHILNSTIALQNITLYRLQSYCSVLHPIASHCIV